jgi:hypothetical protein
LERHFQILDTALSLDAPAQIVAPIACAYRRFEVDAIAPQAQRITLAAAEAPTIRVGDRDVALIPDWDPTLQVYQHFLSAAMDGIGAYAVIHAAALIGPGGDGAVLLAAPSGFGKTSLTLELATRGLRFMSDDYAPLDLGSRRVSPYPRAVGIIVDDQAPLPTAFRVKAEEPGTTRLFGKSLVDVGDVLGEDAVAREPIALRHVILLAADASGSTGATRLGVAGLARHADELSTTFTQTPGVEIVERHVHGQVAFFGLRLDASQHPTELLAPLLESELVLFCEKRTDLRPGFSVSPEARVLKRRETAELLGRELLNRRRGGRLLARYDGRLPGLFLDLAGALREAQCWRVSVGECRATADLIASIVA